MGSQNIPLILSRTMTLQQCASNSVETNLEKKKTLVQGFPNVSGQMTLNRYYRFSINAKPKLIPFF